MSDALIEALRTIAVVLHKYAPRQAGPVHEMLRMAEVGDPNLEPDVCGDRLWGDHGLWDTGPQVLQRPHHDTQACREDELAYRSAFSTLAAAIEARDSGTAEQRRKIREVVATFRTWESDGL